MQIGCGICVAAGCRQFKTNCASAFCDAVHRSDSSVLPRLGNVGGRHPPARSAAAVCLCWAVAGVQQARIARQADRRAPPPAINAPLSQLLLAQLRCLPAVPHAADPCRFGRSNGEDDLRSGAAAHMLPEVGTRHRERQSAVARMAPLSSAWTLLASGWWRCLQSMGGSQVHQPSSACVDKALRHQRRIIWHFAPTAAQDFSPAQHAPEQSAGLRQHGTRLGVASGLPQADGLRHYSQCAGPAITS